MTILIYIVFSIATFYSYEYESYFSLTHRSYLRMSDAGLAKYCITTWTPQWCITSLWPSLRRVPSSNHYKVKHYWKASSPISFVLLKRWQEVVIMSPWGLCWKASFPISFMKRHVSIQVKSSIFSHFVNTPFWAAIRVRRNQRSLRSLTTIQVAESSSAPIATGSTVTSTQSGNPGQKVSDGDSITQRLQDQRDILYRLAEGEGIATQEWDGVLEKCYVCDKWMLEAVFQHHSRDCQCWHISDEEPESEPDRWGME